MKHDKNKLERVMVSIRVRPFSEEEKQKDSSTPIESIDNKSNRLTVKKDYDKKTFTFDKIYPLTSIQEDVFEYSGKRVVESVLKGYNGTIFAYGQTGTGKTYTMVGDFENKKNKGIIPRAFDYIFDEMSKDTEHKYNISISFIQIYLESIQDLLEPKNREIRIREDPEQGVYLEGVQKVKVNNISDVSRYFHLGEKNRVTESTKMNSHSSRSHAILICEIEKKFTLSKEKIEELSKESNEKIKAERVMTKSSLFLVDLAGSERVKKTKAENLRLEEAKKINYSLLVLGNCIQALTESKPTYLPYRDSKLTRLLQESLGGNAKTSLIVTVSPSGYNTDETVSSLNFAFRAMKVQNKPIINKSVDYQALSIKLQEDLDKLQDEYNELKIKYDKAVNELKKLKNGEVFVKMQRNSIINNLGIPLNEIQNNLNSEEDNYDDNNQKSSPFSLADNSNKKNNNNINNNNINNINKNDPRFNKRGSLSNLTPMEKEEVKEEIKKLDKFYKELLENKTKEYENILKDVDKILFEKENTIDALTKENNNITSKFNSLNETIKDNQKEKEDLMNSITDLTNKLNIMKENKNEDQYKKEIEDLNNNIKDLEAKIIPLENNNNLNKDSINNFLSTVELKIKELKSNKSNLIKEKSNSVIKISQNEIKMKINNDEIDNINIKLKTVTEEMKKILENRKIVDEEEIKKKKEENEILKIAQEKYAKDLEQIDENIKQFKNLKENLPNLNSDDMSQFNKTELICKNKFNELNNLILENNEKYLSENYKLIKEENEKLKIELNNLKNDVEKINTEKNNNKEKENMIKEINSEKEKNDFENQKLVAEESNQKIKNYLLQINSKNNDIAKLQNENKNLNKKIKDKEKKQKDLETTIQTQNTTIEENKKKNNDLLNQIIQLKEKNNNQLNENEQLKIQISQKNNELEKINNSAKNVESTNVDSVKQIKSLNNKISEHLLTINAKENNIKKLEQEKTDLKNVINEREKEIKDKDEINQEFQKKLLSQEKEKEKLMNQILKYQNEVADLNTKFNNLHINFDELKSKYDILSEDKKTLEKHKEALENDLNENNLSNKKKILSLTNEKVKLEENIEFNKNQEKLKMKKMEKTQIGTGKIVFRDYLHFIQKFVDDIDNYSTTDKVIEKKNTMTTTTSSYM